MLNDNYLLPEIISYNEPNLQPINENNLVLKSLLSVHVKSIELGFYVVLAEDIRNIWLISDGPHLNTPMHTHSHAHVHTHIHPYYKKRSIALIYEMKNIQIKIPHYLADDLNPHYDTGADKHYDTVHSLMEILISLGFQTRCLFYLSTSPTKIKVKRKVR